MKSENHAADCCFFFSLLEQSNRMRRMCHRASIAVGIIVHRYIGQSAGASIAD